MSESSASQFRLAPQYQPLMRVVGLDAEAVFHHPDIVAWRKLPDRENCTLDAQFEGKPVRLHIKRHHAGQGSSSQRTPAEIEAQAIMALQLAQIPTMNLIGWGRLADGRNFIITEDLAGYRA